MIASPEDAENSYEELDIHNAVEVKEGIDNDSMGTNRITANKIIGSWEVEIPEKTGVHLRGYFKAPRSGRYKFWVTSDDSALVYLNKNEMTHSITESDKILEKTRYSYQRNYFKPYGFS